ncbi:MAG: class I SAM-dependent methyltransferase [Actinobacteria bacterium]|nr:class I SAM-dependent methyltransferase [Actinomycetota bacterium]
METDPRELFSQEYWDDRYGAEPIWSGQPNPLLARYAAELTPGTALDVGSGEGADVIWLATRGWTVTGADISPVALRRAAGFAAQAGPDVAARITWQQADLLRWPPPEGHFDLVSAQFVHLPAAEREALHRRLAAAVRPGGTLLVVSHHPSDLHTGHRPQLPEMFATAEQMAVVLDPRAWDIETSAPGREATFPDGETLTIHDAVLRAVRRPA